MNQDYTDISIVQDRSSSMNSVRDETITGFNAFIAEQKALPGKCLVTMMQFNTEFKLLYNGEDVKKVEPLTHQTYRPDGYTALLDAVARTIITTGQRLEAMPEAERPAKVVCVIITDGEENSSKEYGGPEGRAKVFQMIKQQTEAYKWNFIFLGANQDAIQAGAGLGIAAANAMSYASNAKGTSAAYAAVTSNVRSYRMAAGPDADDMLAFKDGQRKEQLDAGAVPDAMNDPAKP